ncbi:MAG: lysine--tRNA ligase [Verrucomicrobia subdivision 3 bacterium]|nr:lysine--tRNA ligase [Limisphaerales bacterium]
MDDTNSLIEQRKAKLAALQAKGIDPFKNKFTPTEACAAARLNYTEGREVALAGRITAHRDMGKSMFIDIRDQSGRLQAYAQKNVLGDEQFGIFQHLDLADFIGVKGTLFTTKTGEISVKLTSFTILAKALRPPPAKWHGLEDTEIRYRQRYLDLIGNPEVKDVFLKRSEIIREIRNFLHGRGYVEVETPMMQAIPGGAAAQPFKTFHNALGCEFYLRIALELYHKRLLVGGIDKLFEIGKNFRNEGLSRKHNPEFTMLEAYEAFGDYETMMETVQGLICHIAENVLDTLVIQHNRVDSTRTAIGAAINRLQNQSQNAFREILKNSRVEDSLATELIQKSREAIDTLTKLQADLSVKPAHIVAKFAVEAFDHATIGLAGIKGHATASTVKEFTTELAEALIGINKLRNVLCDLAQEKTIDLTPNWRRVKYKDLVREKAGADWFDISPAERRKRAHDLGAEISKEYEDFEVTGAVFEKLIEPTLIQPTFVTHLPKELVPLAKLSPDDPTTVEVFECCINGQEISPGYTEQNDPIAQRTTLEHQAGGEQQKLDEDFLVALEHGMPPAGGIGIGIDRLCMMLLGQDSIRDVILFPQLKPK